MLNKLFAFTQDKAEYLYKNSLILQNIDLLILISILAVFVSSVFAQSESIGIFALIATVLTFINLLVKRGNILECNKFELFLVAYFMFAIISLFGSTLFALSFKGFLKVVIYLGFYLSLVQYLKYNQDKIYWIVLIIACCTSYEVFQGLIQTVIRPEAISTWQDTTYLNPEQVINRVYGTLKPLNPNLFGGYLVAAIPTLFAAIGYSWFKNHITLFSFFTLISVLSIYVLLQTGCRGAYLGLFSILIFIALILYKLLKQEFKKIYLSIVGIISALSATFLLSVSSFRARILSIFAMRADSSNAFRFNVYNSCIQMFQDNWLLGIGLGNGNFREIYGLYMKTGFDALSAYNIYLETAVESGIFALIAFIGFLVFVIHNAYKYITNNNYSLDVIIVTAALASIIGLAVHGFVDTVFFRPQIQFIFWTMVAVIRVQTEHKF